jgi:serine/threonine protein kinase
VDRFGPLQPERVVMLLAQACLSLSEAHEHGLVHRDIKPANLFITRLGPEYDYLKVLDFGLVQGEAGDESAHLTAQGFVHGTPAFMSPERSLEQEVDGRSDLYSLGCVAFWLLTGRPVFESNNPSATLLAHAQTAPRAPSAVAKNRIPKELDAVVLHCLEKSPSKRPVSALDLWEDLQGVPSKTPWTQDRARRWWLDNAPERLVAAMK